jgi:hypothetical protein
LKKDGFLVKCLRLFLTLRNFDSFLNSVENRRIYFKIYLIGGKNIKIRFNDN